MRRQIIIVIMAICFVSCVARTAMMTFHNVKQAGRWRKQLFVFRKQLLQHVNGATKYWQAAEAAMSHLDRYESLLDDANHWPEIANHEPASFVQTFTKLLQSTTISMEQLQHFHTSRSIYINDNNITSLRSRRQTTNNPIRSGVSNDGSICVIHFHVPKTGGESINAFMRSANFNYTRIDRSQKFTTAMHALLNISLEHGTLQERNETSPRSKVELYLEIHVRLYLSIRPHKKCLDDNLYFPIMLLIL